MSLRKRLLATVLCILCLFTLMLTPAFAFGEEAAGPEPGLTYASEAALITRQDDAALVYDAAGFKAAIDDNKDIILMNDIVLPSEWQPSATLYSGMFDGNGYALKGAGDGSVMPEPVFREADNAVFIRVRFIDFNMERVKNPTVNAYGALVDSFRNTAGVARMVDCYVQGAFSVTSSVLLESSNNSRFIFAGTIAGQLDAEDVCGVKGLVSSNFSFVDQIFGRSPSAGGLFGIANAKNFAGNELLQGSVIASNGRYFGGLACMVSLTAEGERELLDCKAEYTFNNALSGASGQIHFGGLFRSINNARLVSGCAVKAEIALIEGVTASDIYIFGGIACVQDVTVERQVYSNCSVTFTGEPVRTSIGAGILANNPDYGTPGRSKSVEFINCRVEMDMIVSAAGAGIFLEREYYDFDSGYNVAIVDCETAGSIRTDAVNAIIGGIAAAGPNACQTGYIDSCASSMNLTATAASYSGRIGGIWVNPANRNDSAVMNVSNCLFSGNIELAAAGSASGTANQIYNCDPGVCSGHNNYTYTPGYADPDGPDGLSIAPPPPPPPPPPTPGPVVIGVMPSAFVSKRAGNTNDLSITIIELMSDGTQRSRKEEFSIRNNAAGIYDVGGYSVYVDTKGNDQIRVCQIV